MTQNQIRLAELKENQRHNLATEGEASRHNVVTEEQQSQQIAINKSSVDESKRHNIVSEQQQGQQIAINDFSARENARHNVSTENETNRHNIVQENVSISNLSEQQRHNYATELETNRANVVRENETARSNIAKEAETNRSNLVNESIKQYEAETHRYSNPTATAVGVLSDVSKILPEAVSEMAYDLSKSKVAMDVVKTIDERVSQTSAGQSYVPISKAIGIMSQIQKAKRKQSGGN